MPLWHQEPWRMKESTPVGTQPRDADESGEVMEPANHIKVGVDEDWADFKFNVRAIASVRELASVSFSGIPHQLFGNLLGWDVFGTMVVQ